MCLLSMTDQESDCFNQEVSKQGFMGGGGGGGGGEITPWIFCAPPPPHGSHGVIKK